MLFERFLLAKEVQKGGFSVFVLSECTNHNVTQTSLILFLGDKAEGLAPEHPRSKEELKAGRAEDEDPGNKDPAPNQQRKDAERVALPAPEMKAAQENVVLQNNNDPNVVKKAPEPEVVKKTEDHLTVQRVGVSQQRAEAILPAEQVIHIQKPAQKEEGAGKKQNQDKSILKNEDGDHNAKVNEALPGPPEQKIGVEQQIPADKVVKITGLEQQKAQPQEGAKEVKVQRVDQDLQRPIPNLKELNNNPADAEAVEVPRKEPAVPGEAGENKMEDGAVPDNEQGKPNRDLKLQNDFDLRRRKRDLANEAMESDGSHIISFNHAPDPRVNDLHGALEAHLNAEAGIQVVYSRQIKQVTEKKKR